MKKLIVFMAAFALMLSASAQSPVYGGPALFGTGSGSVTFTALTGAGTSPTIVCRSGYKCTPYNGVVDELTGTSAASGFQFTINLGLNTPTAPICQIWGYDTNTPTQGLFPYNPGTTPASVQVYNSNGVTSTTHYFYGYRCGY